MFWTTREKQAKSQAQRGATDQGARAAVTGGKQMDGFCRTIRKYLEDSGVPPATIYVKGDRELPGFFRPTKEWDMVIVNQGMLVASLELKSQVGPSFGNNFNNRTEEALGNAVDIWTAYREGAFRTSPQPWVGYLLLLEECERAMAPVAVSEPHFSVFPEFKGASYAKRYELLCRKLVRERQYSAACFMLSARTRARRPDNYREPAEDLSARIFLEGLLSHATPMR
jgi:hypothetical protein